MRNQIEAGGSAIRIARNSKASLVFALLTTFCLASIYLWVLVSNTSRYGWITSLEFFVALRGAKEWFTVWVLLWVASVQGNVKALSRAVPVLCLIGLVALDNWLVYAGISSGSMMLVWVPVVIVEVCNLFWMYVGVLLALWLTKCQAVPLLSTFPHRYELSLLSAGLKKRFYRSLIWATGYSVIICLAIVGIWVFFNGGQWPGYARTFSILTYVVWVPLFRFLCGLGVIAVLYLIAFNNRRLTGSMLTALSLVIFIVFSSQLAAWGSHFAMIGLMWERFRLENFYWQIPIIVAMSPVMGFFLSALVIYLCGYRLHACEASHPSSQAAFADELDWHQFDDADNSEMYL